MSGPCGGEDRPVECTTCKKCYATCPSEVDLPDLMRLHRYQRRPRDSHRGLFITTQKLMARSEAEEWLSPALDTGRDDISYFPGCLPLFDELLGWSTNYRRAANAGVAILNRFGISPKIVYGCCGHDLYYSGNLDHFKALKDRLRERVTGRIVVGCAECYHSLKELHGLDVIHISEFLEGRTYEPALHTTVTYHDPCRLGRYHGLYDAPRKVLGALGELREMASSRDEGICCGVSAWLNCNKESKDSRVRRLTEAASTGAEALVTSCCKCRIHLDCVYHEDGYRGDPPEIRVTDLQECVADALGIAVPDGRPAPQGRGRRVIAIESAPSITAHLLANSVDKLFSCTTCERCREVCDFRYDPVGVLEDFRRTFVAAGLNPDPHSRIAERLRETGNAFGDLKKAVRRNVKAEYVYFPGCVAISRRPSLMDDTIAVLDALGVEYEIPEGLVCCGSVLKRTGYDPTYLMARNGEAIGDRPVIASCAGCYSTLSRDYCDVEVVHVSQFLKGRVAGLALNPMRARLAYHDPCHLGRRMGTYDEPRDVLRAIPGTELVEFPESRESAACCGGGGGVKSGKKDLANELGRKRMEAARELGVEVVATSCPFCETNLEENGNIRVLDVVEIVARSLRGEAL